MTTSASSARPTSAAPLLVGFAAAIGVPLGLVLLLVGLGVLGFVLGLVVGVAATALLVRGATPRLLAANGARPADPDEHARLHNVAEGLCVALGLPLPALHVIEDPAANALVLGTDPDGAAMAVTTGLLGAVDRMELEGIVALALTELKAGELTTPTLAAALLGPFSSIGPVAELIPRLGGAPGGVRADAAAVTLTRYPPGLRSALERLDATGTAPRTAAPATAHLWIARPGPSGSAAAHDHGASLDHRIAVLREL